MKKILHTCCAIALTTPLFAGDYTTAPSTATTSSYESSWFLGGGGDYMFDAEDFFWNGHFGYNLNDASALFLELGWTGTDEDVTLGRGFRTNIDVDIVPFTLNYKYEMALGDNLAWYLGGGAGGASLDMDIQGGPSDDDVVFTFQAFTGLVYDFNPAFEGYLGLRYMWYDSTELFGVDVDSLDDIGLGAGLRFNF